MSQLILGTVQFGLDYGITNSSGEIPDQVVQQMLVIAEEHDIRIFDTAADYGNSQYRLGQLAPIGNSNRYVTKFSLPTDGSSPTQENVYSDSMKLLQVEKLHGVLFHKLEDLRDSRLEKTLEILRAGRDAGILSKIGVSIYNWADLELALEVFPDLDLLQLPANVLDMNLLESDEVHKLKSRGVEIHVRSVFLQGLLLTSPSQLSDFFEPLKPALIKLQNVSAITGKSVLELVLAKIRHHRYVDAVLVGATSLGELTEITSAWESASEYEDFELPAVPREILDPRVWPKVRMNP
ncbi:aldo/keto reductase [Aurantimicrobium minutum]|uniref:aldo/keto reductase n=1 Tax=Aurantimicrobium minutum TaxID=708131 RepID=UPI002476B898|nr:aldo/keto reductase [Aurantimicrobium minutum]MDH6536592.1 aryl-alcohol dehydrogenase-like predicted oxidoreductase [Aurantimicrobium minutum]